MPVTYNGVTYDTLTWDDLLLSARDRVRGLETDRFRLSITPSAPNTEDLLAGYDEQIAEAQAVLADIESQAQVNASPPDPNAPRSRATAMPGA